MKHVVVLMIGAMLCAQAQAADTPQVMLFGTFHFKDAGLDVVKPKDIDIFTSESQTYLEDFSRRLAEDFKPTEVLLEYNPENDEEINRRYQQYLADNFELPANEIYQLGFRIARHAGLERVHSFDNRDVQWQAEGMFEYAKAHDSPEMKTFNQYIDEFTTAEEQARANLSLRELLMRANDPALERMNMDLYLATNPIGVGDGYVGAVSTASWWERNFRMYANIQKHAKPGKRVIAIGGSGHMAILKNLLQIDRRMEAVDITPRF